MREDCQQRRASAPRWRRHDLLHVTPDAWASALSRSPSAIDLPLVRDWADRGWPVIVRRRDTAEESLLVPIGVPLPPQAGKRRVALLLQADGVKRHSSPPLLDEAARAAHSAWQSTIDALVALGRRTGVEPRAFGSLLWQHLTGLTYLSPSSDIDLLWPVPASFDISSLLFGIAEAQRHARLRIDGEILFPDGSGVNWRELWSALGAKDRATVLAKTMEGVRLLDLNLLMGAEQVA
jgi:phosphoribosyl-dephospho-CoA transferase